MKFEMEKLSEAMAKMLSREIEESFRRSVLMSKFFEMPEIVREDADDLDLSASSA